MISVVDHLLHGNERIASQFQSANIFWKDFFEGHKDWSEDELANELGDVQIMFEWECFGGDRALGKEVMALTCIGSLYDASEGFSDRAFAKNMVRAFRKSMVSIEVKGIHLDKVEEMYDLKD